MSNIRSLSDFRGRRFRERQEITIRIRQASSISHLSRVWQELTPSQQERYRDVYQERFEWLRRMNYL